MNANKAQQAQALAAVKEQLALTGWRVAEVPALTLPDPARVVGFEAWHPRIGKRVVGSTLDELVSRVTALDAGKAVSP